jgi:hypothetical protein
MDLLLSHQNFVSDIALRLQIFWTNGKFFTLSDAFHFDTCSMESNSQIKPVLFRPILLIITIVLMVTVLFLHLPYLINMIVIGGEYRTNHAKWQKNGSQNYVIRTTLNDFSPFRGINTVTVKNGEITRVEADSKNQYPKAGNSSSLNNYSFITIKGMFQTAHTCGFQPVVNYWHSIIPSTIEEEDDYWYSCEISYDPVYGYPTRVVVDCANTDQCFQEIEVMEMKILPKP